MSLDSELSEILVSFVLRVHPDVPIDINNLWKNEPLSKAQTAILNYFKDVCKNGRPPEIKSPEKRGLLSCPHCGHESNIQFSRWGDDYNQAIKDYHDNLLKALEGKNG